MLNGVAECKQTKLGTHAMNCKFSIIATRFCYTYDTI